MDIVNIQKREAITAYNKANNKEKALLENIFGKELFNQKITDRVKNMDDVYSELGIDKISFEKSFIFKEDLDAAKIRLIVKVFNEGWEPDWNNHNQYKYIPYFEPKYNGCFSLSDCGVWAALVDGGSRLCFKSRELAVSVPEMFKTEYENYILIKK